MADPRLHPLLRYLRQALGAPAGSGVSDAELLRRFVEERDEAAFELLLWRHAAAVLHVCRQVLRDAEAVEDAFQATFLVFVRKAGSIGRGEAIGGWLYRVAYHTALKSRQQIAKRTSAEHELESVDPPAASADDAGLRELRRMICEEVSRLPARYRTPIVACFFEGKTHEEAARQLGWPRGTVASRLARGRELLRRRLIRRGITLSAAAFTAALSVPTSSAALTELIQSTIQTAKLFSTGQSANAALSPHVADLVEGVLKAMYWTRVKIVMVVLLIVGLGGAGTVFWGMSRSAAEPTHAETAARPKAAADKDKPDEAQAITRNMALSRLNLKKLALAMIDYAEANKGLLPPPALINKEGKAVLSWRVLLLPYLGERELYEQFKLSEPWDSPHNKKLLSKMPRVFAPPGVKTRQPFSTFYQVFVSPKPKDGRKGAEEGGPLGVEIQAAFVQGQPQIYPAHFPDGLANTILIVESGEAVPWTKPKDLSYAADKPLPELGGLFPGIFHATFANGDVHRLTKKYDEHFLRTVITSNGLEVMNFKRIESQSAAVDWQRKNGELRQNLENAREHLRLLQEERDALQGRFGGAKRPSDSDTRLDELRKENARLQEELEKTREDLQDSSAEVQRRLRKPMPKEAP